MPRVAHRYLHGPVKRVSARKHLERSPIQASDQVVEASRLKSEFLATMSHEIRTPLNSIIGMTDLLLETALDHKQQEMARIARDAGQTLLAIVDDILQFSEIEAGNLVLEEIDFPLVELVGAVTESLVPRAYAKQLALRACVDPKIPPLVRGDPERLRQILLNLLSNAVKFTERGEIVVRVTLVDLRDGHAVVNFSVADTGIGISDVARLRLFQPFTQADGSTSRRYGGTGLGLATSKRLVELMGGEIGAQNSDHQGATFWFILRFSLTDPVADIAQARQGDRLADKMAPVAGGCPPDTGIIAYTEPDGLSKPLASGHPILPAEDSTAVSLASVLDETTLSTLHDIQQEAGAEAVRALVGMFLHNTPARLETLRAAIAARDARGLERAAHALKGSCGSFGARALAEMCQALEEIGNRGTVVGAGDRIPALLDEYKQVSAALCAKFGITPR